MEKLFEDLGVILDNYLCGGLSSSYEENEKIFLSTIIYCLSNNDEQKYNQICNIVNPNITEIIFSICGDKRGSIKEDNDKFMWIIRFGLSGGNEELTKTIFEIVTGKVAIDIIEN